MAQRSLTAPDRPAPAPGSGRRDDPGSGGAAPPGRTRAGIGKRLARAAESAWRPALLLGALLAIWWFVTWREYVAPYLVPPPGDVWDVLVEQRADLARHTWVTTYETLLGFVLAALIGVGAAVLIVYSSTMEKAIYPIILFAQVIPKIAIAPILVVWFGFGMTPKVVLAVLIAFFPVVISGVAGLRSTDPELLDLSATMGATRWQTFRKIRFPGALPHLMAGLKVAVTLAVVGAVVGEFVGAKEGLGFILLAASGNLDSALLFADLFLMSAIGIVLFVLVEAAEALLIPWHASRRDGMALTTT
jgi:NitT/TauT family transport system permease protein